MKKILAAVSVLLALCIGGMSTFAAEAAKPAAKSAAKSPVMMTEEELVAYLKSLSIADFAKTIASAIHGTNRSFGIRAVSAAMTVMSEASPEKRAEYVAELKKTIPELRFSETPGVAKVAIIVTPANSPFTNTMGADETTDALVGGNATRIANPPSEKPSEPSEEEEEDEPISRPARKRGDKVSVGRGGGGKGF